MRKSVASFAHTLVAALMAAALTFSMVPLAWADDGPAGTVAGTVAGNTAEGSESPEDAAATEGMDAQAPEAEVRSADAKAAASTGDAATGTTIKIAVYRSSYPLVWDLNDAGAPDATKAKWDNKPEKWPTEGSPGSAVGTCEGYVSWTDDRDPGSEPSRTGFNFLGWSTSPTVAVEGTGRLDTLSIPKDTQPVAGEDGAKSITLYALWAPINYSVVFDLTKNPEDASATPSFNWTTGKGTFSDLGGGRYRLSGVTLQDYDPSTGLIEISTPSRGTGGYRFLSWAEPDSQQDPAVAVKKPGSSKWYVNPVALPHYDYEPVLTARWSLSFDVDVPSQVTFDEYDSLEVEGNLTDTTDEDAIDEESPDAHDAGKKAHFCSQSTATDYKIVALRSVRQETASKILTTSDSAKATQEEVLGSERLLSLFAEGATAESQGVHFKLDDDVDMDDSTRYGSFVIPKQQAPFDPTATERDDESRLYVSYRLNLSNKVGDSETPNHGLVTPGGVSEGDRTPIAEVSYEFAVADGEVDKTIPGDPFYINDNGTVYGLGYIKRAADDIAANGTASSYYGQFKGWLDAQVMTNGNPGPGPYFMMRVKGATADDGYLPVQLIGICQDTKSDGTGKAGLTFQTKDIFEKGSMNAEVTSVGGWRASEMREFLRTGFMSSLDLVLQAAIVPVDKYQQLRKTETDPETKASLQKTTSETVWLPSLSEVYGMCEDPYNASEMLVFPGYESFQYQAYGNGGSQERIKYYHGQPLTWWLRSVSSSIAGSFCDIGPSGERRDNTAWGYYGIAPCFCL